VSSEPRFLGLRDRAYALLATSESVADEALLAHVYGGATPAALRDRLVAPLLGDPRFERRPDGSWSLLHAAPDLAAFTALALAATGPSPARGRIVCLAALRVVDGAVKERFMATVAPGVRVPHYVAARLGLDASVLEGLAPFDTVLEPLVEFLGDRPVLAQDAPLTWAFVDAEARRARRTLAEPTLIDVNDLATRALTFEGKPTLARIAAHFGVSSVRIESPEEEARVLAAVGGTLLARAHSRGLDVSSSAARLAPALRRGSTARVLPNTPGVYTLRDADQQPLYVGKARRLRSRMEAYVHRPLGATRRLEGLVGSVDQVDPRQCETDLEALILEDREIRRLQPRFNTVRQQRMPRLWIRLPPLMAQPGRALRRLALAETRAAPGEYVGPFRNETVAEQARSLARDVFELDRLRRADPFAYESQLGDAWQFLHGARDLAEARARQRSTRLLRAVLAFDVNAALLPADPLEARLVVLRPHDAGLEAFVIDAGVCVAWRVFDDPLRAEDVLSLQAQRSTPDDIAVVLRWMGALRPPARLVRAEIDLIQDAALALWEARAASAQDALDAFGDPGLGGSEIV
jgi:DNA polymerase III epsilon subunit-like protein